jgi:type IV pilus assembly protein PilW
MPQLTRLPLGTTWSHPLRRRVRGLSLVELMVGIAVGMFVVAAAALLTSSQLSDNRRLLMETQMQQDMRWAADAITRELRRAGAMGNQAGGGLLAWPDGTGPVATIDRRTQLQSVTVTGGAQGRVDFRRADARAQLGSGAPPVSDFEYYLRLGNDGVLWSKTAGGSEQQMTDPATLEIRSLDITPEPEPVVALPCPKPCPGADPDACWPTVGIRSYSVTIVGRARRDASIERTLTTRVTLRNDALTFNNGSTDVCPL